MTPALSRSACALVLIGSLAACGGGGGASSDWAVDACKTLPADAASKASGVAVAKAELASAAVSNEQTTLSNCSYSTADGKINFGVMLRQDKTGQTNIAEQFEGLKSQPDMTGPMVDVAVPKGKAAWATKLRTLTYVPDDLRMIVVTPPGAIVIGGPTDPDDVLKAKALALAEAAAH